MSHLRALFLFFFFNDTATTEIYTLSLHDALPIWMGFFVASPFSPTGRATFTRIGVVVPAAVTTTRNDSGVATARSEEHTSELQSPCNLVCRLLLEKKKTE